MAEVALEEGVANKMRPAEQRTFREYLSLICRREWRKMDDSTKMTVATSTDCAFATANFIGEPYLYEDVYYFGNNNLTAFQCEAIMGHTNILLTMLETIKTNMPSMYQSSLNNAMCLAGFGSHVELVRLLVDMGADVNAEFTVVDCPIMQALCADTSETIPDADCLQMVRLLVARGPVPGRTIFRSLRCAAVRKRTKVVRYLLSILPDEYKSHLHIVLYELLHRSRDDIYYDLVKFLLESGANPNFPCDDDACAEGCVVPRDDVHVADTLKALFQQEWGGGASFHRERPSSKPIAPDFVALYAIEAVYKEDGEFLAYLLLAEKLSYRTMEMLLDYGFDPDRLDKKQRLLFHTVQLKHPIVVALLLNAYCDPNPVYCSEGGDILPLDVLEYCNRSDCYDSKKMQQIVPMLLEAGSNMRHRPDMDLGDNADDTANGVIRMIRHFRNSPMSLMQQSRTTLRKTAKKYNDSLPFNMTRRSLHGFVDALPVPDKIKNYIKLKDILQSTVETYGFELCSSDGSFKRFNYGEYAHYSGP